MNSVKGFFNKYNVEQDVDLLSLEVILLSWRLHSSGEVIQKKKTEKLSNHKL